MKDEALAQQLAMREELDFLRFDAYKERILDGFRKSKEYKDDMDGKIIAYLDKMNLTILR